MAEGGEDGQLKVFNWNIMGYNGKGWANVRTELVLHNIRGYDIVFLQEVQWVEKGTQERLAIPARYKLAMSESESRNSCILYNPEKLQRDDNDTDTITKTIKSEKGWTAANSKELCVQVFTLIGKETASKFVAISLHASRSGTKEFSDLVKASIKKVVANHKLPVLVGADFNRDVYDWKDDGFLGFHEITHKRIDFIMMKVPDGNHLEIGEVQILEDIDIPDQDLQVKRKGESAMIKVGKLKNESKYNFFLHLCDSHKPLTVVVKYYETWDHQKQDKKQVKSEGGSGEEVMKMQKEELRDVNPADEVIAELKEKCRRQEKRIAELEQEVKDLQERLQKYENSKTTKKTYEQ